MARQINVRKEGDSWRAVVEDGHKLVVVEGFFEDETEAARAAMSVKI